jgi:polyhydroxybutyrate depolymerase
MGPGGQGPGGGGGATGGGAATGGGGGGQASAGCGKALVRSVFGDADGDGTPEAEVPLVVGGVTRRAVIRFPAGYDATTPAPVVFEFHGDQDLGFTTDPLTFTQGIFGADEYGGRAIVVALRGENLVPPQVRDDFAGFVSWDTLSGAATNPDVAAFRAFRGLLEERACTARDKVFAVGFSGGGFFAQTLRCSGEPLAGIANFQSGLDFPAYPFLVDDAGAPLHLDLAGCSAAPVPQLVVHFTADTTVVLQQGVDTATYWAQKHGCAPLASARPSALDGACVEFDGCGAREDVVLCRPPGGGHEIWSPDGARVLSAFLSRFF